MNYLSLAKYAVFVSSSKLLAIIIICYHIQNIKGNNSKYLHEILIALRNTLTYKINLPQRLHSDMQHIIESTCLIIKICPLPPQKRQRVIYFAHFNMAEDLIISKQ